MEKSPEREVERYLRAGERDDTYLAWPGFVRAQHGSTALRGAVISAVRSRTTYATAPKELAAMDVVAFTRKKIEPIVRGLFPHDEQETVLDVLGRSVVFLSPATIDNVLNEIQWPGTAWTLANLYLASYGGELLSEDVPRIVGLSLETTRYLSVDYFGAQERFDDFVPHEVAHIFHNCKRRTIGLREIRGHEWLLEIDFCNRKTFVYACEGYGHILELGDCRAARRMLLSEIENGPMPPDDYVDAEEYIDILREAVAARNGWKRIPERCSPHRAARRTGARAV
jgi:hypothetical protein